MPDPADQPPVDDAGAAQGAPSPWNAIDLTNPGYGDLYPGGLGDFSGVSPDLGHRFGRAFMAVATGQDPDTVHPSVRPLMGAAATMLRPEPPLGPGLFGSMVDISGIADQMRSRGLLPVSAGAPLADSSDFHSAPRPPVTPTDLQLQLPDQTYGPDEDEGDGDREDDEEGMDDDSGAVTEAGTAAKRAFVNPWGRTVPVYPNVKDFVTKNWAAAQRLASQLPGVTPEQFLTALGTENNYGADRKASQYGNYGGIHHDPSKGYFPGQTGVFDTKGKIDPKSGKVIGVQQMAQFPTDKGFELSGRILVNRLKPFIPSGGVSDPKQFFDMAHAHGWGTTNDKYLDTVYGRDGSYWLIKAAAQDRNSQ
jgi:hypothetical protein